MMDGPGEEEEEEEVVSAGVVGWAGGEKSSQASLNSGAFSVIVDLQISQNWQR